MTSLKLPEPSKAISPRAIAAATAAHYETTVGEIIAYRYDRVTVHRRHVAFYLSKRLTMLSTPAIGRILGGWDHSTVINGASVLEDKISGDPKLCEDLQAIAWSVAAVANRGKLAAAFTDNRDPLNLAIDIATGSMRESDVSVQEIDMLARCLVGYARAAGDIAIVGEQAPEPDPEPVQAEPEPVQAPEPSPAMLIQAERFRQLLTIAIHVGRARDALASSVETRSERQCRDALDLALDRLAEQVKIVKGTSNGKS